MPTTRGLSSREKVIRAATALFAAKGFGGTSTRHVATKARVNETTIFRLFKNKQDLYLQVLDHNKGFKEPERLPQILQSSENPEKASLSLAEYLEELFNPVFLRLLFYAALEKPDLLRKRYGPNLVSFYEVLGKHISEGIDKVIRRDIDPILMGRALVGMIAYHRIAAELLAGPDFPEFNVDGTAKVYADIWLRGVLTREAPARQNLLESPLVQPKVSALHKEQCND